MSDRTSNNELSLKALGTQSPTQEEDTNDADSDPSKKDIILPDIFVNHHVLDTEGMEQWAKMPDDKNAKDEKNLLPPVEENPSTRVRRPEKKESSS